MPRPTALNITLMATERHDPVYEELIVLLAETLGRLGIKVSRSRGGLVADRPNLILGFTAFLDEGVLAEIEATGKPWFLFQTEPLDLRLGDLPKRPGFLEFLKRAPVVWDYSRDNLAFLQGIGVSRAHYIPIGHAKALERIPVAPEAGKSIDVLFFGRQSPRRMEILNRIAAQGLKVQMLVGSYGQARDQEVAKAKVILNLHFFELAALEQIRISYLLNNRCCVVSEASGDDPYGGAVTFAPPDRLPETCRQLCAPGAEVERRRRAEAGYRALQALDMQGAMAEALDALPF